MSGVLLRPVNILLRIHISLLSPRLLAGARGLPEEHDGPERGAGDTAGALLQEAEPPARAQELRGQRRGQPRRRGSGPGRRCWRWW